MKPDRWTAQVKRTLKAELKMRKISYSDLADKLAAIGIEEHEKKHRQQNLARYLQGRLPVSVPRSHRV